jgi:hypothetical protein
MLSPLLFSATLAAFSLESKVALAPSPFKSPVKV